MTYVRLDTPGHYYPRIYRGNDTIFDLKAERARTDTAVSLRLLLTDLNGIFEVVAPEKRNFRVYGPRIRHLLIAACTEVEAGWVGALKANRYRESRPKTSDYVRLLEPMRLAEYNAKLVDYPAYPVIEPFRGWSASRSTTSLPWYHAYNQTKHDREANLNEATIGHAIAAVAACLIVACAQYGTDLFMRNGRFRQTSFNVNGPVYAVMRDGYLPPPSGGRWVLRGYPFRRASAK